MRFSQLLFTVFILFTACKSAQEKYNDQNYKGAFDEALSDLKKGKDKNKNLAIVKKSLKQIVGQYKSLQVKLTNAQVADKVPLADANIDLLSRLDRTSDYIIIDSFYNYKNLQNENANLTNEVGNYFKNDAIDLIEEARASRRKQPAQDGYYLIVKAEKYLGPKNELKNLKTEAEKFGTIVSNITVDYWLNDFNSWDVNNRFDDLENTSSLFEKTFYNKSITRNELDCDIEVEIQSINFRETTDRDFRTFTDKIIDRYDVKIDSNGKRIEIPVYKEIQGKVEILVKTITAVANVTLDVNKITSDCPYTRNYWTEDVKTTLEEYRLSGDQRAIPDQYKNSAGNSPKSKDRLKEDLLDEIYNKVRNELD